MPPARSVSVRNIACINHRTVPTHRYRNASREGSQSRPRANHADIPTGTSLLSRPLETAGRPARSSEFRLCFQFRTWRPLSGSAASRHAFSPAGRAHRRRPVCHIRDKAYHTPGLSTNTEQVGATHASSLQQRARHDPPTQPCGPQPQSIGSIVGWFKSAVTRWPAWLEGLGYTVLHGPNNAPGEPFAERIVGRYL